LIAEGWDNVSYRLGETLLVRLPRRLMAAPLAWNEQRWLPLLAPGLPVAVPAPVRTGRAGCGYPWCWSIVPWIGGTPAFDAPLRHGAKVGAFLRPLHQPAPEDAPTNPYRGGPLADREKPFRDRVASLASRGLRPAGVETAWERGLAAPAATEAVWLHG